MHARMVKGNQKEMVTTKDITEFTVDEVNTLVLSFVNEVRDFEKEELLSKT